MTSPAKQIEVECPTCGLHFMDWYTASINMGLGEEWSKARIAAATSVACPHCQTVTPVQCLIVDESGVFHESTEDRTSIAQPKSSPEIKAGTTITYTNEDYEPVPKSEATHCVIVEVTEDGMMTTTYGSFPKSPVSDVEL